MTRTIWNFFFPAPDKPRWVRVLPFVVLGLLTALLAYGGAEAWTYTNSPEFCGTTCHTMPPEFNSYLKSPHARVQCVECHLGRDPATELLGRKAGEIRHVTAILTSDYEFPIYAHNMRPANELCEQCHFPQKFSDDSLRQISNFVPDEANTEEDIYLIMKTGGGSEREGLGRGIHWHIENEVLFLATDELEQEIPYVRVVDAEGKVKEYYDVTSGVAPDDVAGTYLTRMDCITCHNRVTHTTPGPVDAVELALKKGLISRDLPAIRRQGAILLKQEYGSEAEARRAFASLNTFYQRNFPDIVTTRQAEIQQAIDTLTDIYTQSIYPEQKIGWETHPNNLGHKDFPGCFRCHDGQHLTGTGEAIRLECNICHSIPVTRDPQQSVTLMEVVTGPEPVSHTHSNWIALHGRAIDTSCATCHTSGESTPDYTDLTAGSPPPSDGSFCGNSSCHANEWGFAGFNEPLLEPILERQLYILLNTSPYLLEGVPRTYAGTFQSIFDGRCIGCHTGDEAEAGLDLTSYTHLLQGGETGPGLVPGDPGSSLIMQRQTRQTAHFGQMLDDELEAVRDWIVAGAPEG